MKLKLKSLAMRLIASALTLSLCAGSMAALAQEQTSEKLNDAMFPVGGIGANFNEHLNTIVFEDMADTGTVWARGFLPYFALKDGAANGTVDLKTDERIQKIKRLKEEGYHTIVSLKFNYTGKHFPTTQAGYDEALSYLDTLLGAIYPYTDIIVSGNEPFIESLTEERNATLINFYKEITNRVHEYVLKQEREIPIFIGALNQMWNNTFQQTYHQEDYIQYAKETPWIAGMDLHIHHKTMAEFDTAMECVSKKLRDDQKIIVTEFSAVQYWKSHTSEAMPKIMAEKYGYNSSWKVHQYINYAAKNRDNITIQEWEDFLGNCKWYTDMQDYLLDAYNRFIQNDKFYVATYGMYIFFDSDNKTFGPDNDPWLLNSLYATSTVQKDANGRYQKNYNMLPNFQLIQEMTNSDKTYVAGCVKNAAVGADVGTDLDSVLGMLPKTVKISTNKGIKEAEILKWESENYKSDATGKYTFKGTLKPADFENPKNYTSDITVIVSPKIEYEDILLPEPEGTDLWFKFDESADADGAADCINNIKTTVFEAQFAPQGVSGGCVSFDGKGEKIQLGNNTKGSNFFNKGYSARTMSFWFKPDSIEGKQMLVETGGNLAGMGVRINNGVVEAAVSSNIIGNAVLTTSDINRWKHVALSYNKGACKFYVDGKLAASKTISLTQINDPANPSDMACNVNKSNAFDDSQDAEQYYGGLIDDLRFYTSAVVPKVADKTADKSALNMAVQSAKQYKQEQYTVETWTAFAKALADAEAVLADASANSSRVDSALSGLEAAVKGLVKIEVKPDPQPDPGEDKKPDDNKKPDVQKPGSTVKPAKVKVPAKVKKFTAKKKGRKITLTIKKSASKNKTYIEYRKGSKGKFKRLTITAKTRFAKKFKKGKYQFRAYSYIKVGKKVYKSKKYRTVKVTVK